VAPAGTPADIVNRLHDGISKVLANPELQPLFDAQALDRGDPMSPAAFGNKIQREMALWEKAVRASGMQVEGRK
jgi:tripartite-type tricarboxylate transporter receptor subunit TctC